MKGEREEALSGLANEFEVENDGNEDEKDDDYCSSDDALLVHSRGVDKVLE